MFGVFVGSAALIIILSVFNGFENVILSMYNSFSPELRVEPAYGKYLDPDQPSIRALASDSRIANYSEVLQEKALLRYGKAQYIGTVKGVSKSFMKRNNLDSILIDGNFTLNKNGIEQTVVGATVQAALGINVFDDLTQLEIYSPRKGAVSSINPADEFNISYIHPSGVFNVQQDYNEILIVPMDFARKLLDEPRMISSVEIFLKPGISVEAYQKDLKEKLKKNYIVKNRVQQNELLYKVLNMEKWAIYVILTFVLIIAIFNLVGSLTMLVIDKKKDIAILSSIGASEKLIKRIFFYEGIMIAMAGCVMGLAAGLIFCLLQQRYGFISMGQVKTITESYPIGLRWTDFLLVFFTVCGISLLTAEVSSRLSVKTLDQIKENL